MRIAVAGGTGVAGGYAVEAARAAGHEVVVLSRTVGVDVCSGAGLDAALEGVDACIDATNPDLAARAGAAAFFVEVANRLQVAGARAGLRRLVVLSIVGIDRAAAVPYYAAKLAHERAALAGPLSVAILRTTQFHEYPGQVLDRARRGPFARIPITPVQTVAARTVGEALVELATSPVPPEALSELAGPTPGELVALARAVARARGDRLVVFGTRGRDPARTTLRAGALLPSPGSRRSGPGFATWLAGADGPARGN